MTRDRRWTARVYEVGDEPDYRFSFANERTFLAWIRTALAFVAAGVALDVVETDLDAVVQRGVAIALVAAGMFGCGLSWLRWARPERAIRLSALLLPAPAAAVLAAALVLVTAVVIWGL